MLELYVNACFGTCPLCYFKISSTYIKILSLHGQLSYSDRFMNLGSLLISSLLSIFPPPEILAGSTNQATVPLSSPLLSSPLRHHRFLAPSPPPPLLLPHRQRERAALPMVAAAADGRTADETTRRRSECVPSSPGPADLVSEYA